MSNLFAEFPPVTTEEWMAAITHDLKGVDFKKRLVKKTLDGIELRPFYRAEDLPETVPSLDVPLVTTNREEVREPSLEAAHLHLEKAIRYGSTEFAVGIYPMGPVVDTVADLETLLEGIDLTKVAIHWSAGALGAPFASLFVEYLDRTGVDKAEVLGSIDLDPIMDRACKWTSASLDSWSTDWTTVAETILRTLPKFGLLGIRGALIEKAGASIAQELAYTAGLLADYLDAAHSAGLNLSEVVKRSEVRLGVGTNFVLEVAKLRAARLVLGQVCTSFGVAETPKLLAVTTSSNKTLYDAHNNLLRATIESMASVIGGADSLSVAAYDQGFHTPDEFSEHLSRNTLSLLLEEAHFGRVADPLAGSYAVEKLTSEYAEAAWNLFLQIQERGGFLGALEWIDDELKTVRQQRTSQVDSRQRTFIGTTAFANPYEARLADVRVFPEVKVVAPFEGGSVASLREYITSERVASSVFQAFRPSWPVEQYRLRIENSIAQGNERPPVWLILCGDAKMREARATFCQGFLAAGGYDLHQITSEDVEKALLEAQDEGAKLVVLCSSDPEYLGYAASIKTSGVSVPVWVAGKPVDALDVLKEEGVADFIHIRSGQLETLSKLHRMFGVPDFVLPSPQEVMAR